MRDNEMQPMVLCALLAALILGEARPVSGGGQLEHHTMPFAMAFLVGFNDRDSKILADASWSVDLNPALTTSGRGGVVERVRWFVRLARDPAYRRALLEDDAAFERELSDPGSALAPIAQGAFHHALVDDARRQRNVAIRPQLEAAYHAYIRKQAADFAEVGMRADHARTATLILIGQYTHNFVDAYPHPYDPLWGHSRKGQQPDLAWQNVESYTDSAHYLYQALRVMRMDLPGADDRQRAFRLQTLEAQRTAARSVVEAITAGYWHDLMAIWWQQSPLVFWPGEIVSASQKSSATSLVQEYLWKFLDERGWPSRPDVPTFDERSDKVIYEPVAGGRYRVRYQNVGFAVPTFIAWIHSRENREKYRDLRGAVRETVRADIRDAERIVRELIDAVARAFDEATELVLGINTRIERERELAAWLAVEHRGANLPEPRVDAYPAPEQPTSVRERPPGGDRGPRPSPVPDCTDDGRSPRSCRCDGPNPPIACR